MDSLKFDLNSDLSARNVGKGMKAFDREEKQILSDFEAGKLKSTVASEASLRRYREYARATLSKNKRVNIR